MESYKVVNGTSYHINTPDMVIKVLEECRINKTRIVVDYGNTVTGESWGEVNDITGYIGRSTGSSKIPLLIYNSRSLGGNALLTDCIIGIKTTKSKRVLY